MKSDRLAEPSFSYTHTRMHTHAPLAPAPQKKKDPRQGDRIPFEQPSTFVTQRTTWDRSMRDYMYCFEKQNLLHETSQSRPRKAHSFHRLFLISLQAHHRVL